LRFDAENQQTITGAELSAKLDDARRHSTGSGPINNAEADEAKTAQGTRSLIVNVDRQLARQTDALS
jgi:hypothetical protein